MKITYHKGDLLESNCDYICHQVNCQGKMGSGLALQVRNRWPQVYEEYVDFCENIEENKWLLGLIQLVKINEKTTVVNMFGQYNYGSDGKRYTSYDAFWDCLQQLNETVPDKSTVGIPSKIGCVRGGANFGVILNMIIETFQERDIDIQIWEFEA